MDNIELLPKSKIIIELESKSKCRSDIQLDYIDILANFKTKVCQEASYINQLFPEYTPHDEPNHLSRLFSLADDILGTTLIDNLNSTELLILSLSLYGHDWGMAVSQEERNLISGDSKINGDCNFVLLSNDQEQFKRLLKEQGVKEPDNLIWQEYIRNTHARRSQERIIKYFSQINSGLGLAVGKVCHAHALDIEKLQDDNDYPVTHTVLQESVNLRAIAIYVRLIDLLDITEWRTPYTIWKYVAPKNSRSKMEWKKHRAVSSIKTAQYENIRSVIVAASTDDHSVYASLIDLKNYCDEQLKGCNALLYRSNNSRYYLNIHEIIWNIDARGFKPISIQFEFDRIKMFEILSDEIYQTDIHVFIRELIQNSIDAIRLRSKLLVSRGIPNSIEDIGKIEVTVFENGEDIIEVRISDNGVGMDEYIIRNYFSVAGKSYYKSKDFEKLGIKLDPISKFGIGVLSCFMVADSLEIITTRESYLSKNATTLKLNIDSVNTQFKVQEMSESNDQQGTTIKVYVSKSKIKSKIGENHDSNLYITDYISIVAAFSEIPILITENSVKTIVISPYTDIAKIKTKYPEFEIKTIELTINNKEIFSDHSKDGSTDYFTQHVIDLNKDLGIQNVNGTMSYTIPKGRVDLISSDNSWPSNSYTLKTKDNDFRITLNEQYIRNGRLNGRDANKYGESAKTSPRVKVYLKGILVNSPTIFGKLIDIHYMGENGNKFNAPFYLSSLDEQFVPPILTINILDNLNINVSRSAFINEENATLDEEIGRHLTKFLVSKELKNKDLTAIDKALKIIDLRIYYGIDLNMLFDDIGLGEVPILFYSKENKVTLKEWKEFINEEIYTQIDDVNLIKETYSDLSSEIVLKENIPTSNFVIYNLSTHDDELQGKNLKALFSVTKRLLIRTHNLHSIRFYSTDKNHIITQSRWKPKNQTLDIDNDKLLESIISDVTLITSDNISQILTEINSILRKTQISPSSFCCFASFEKPYEKSFAYSKLYININHPFTIAIVKLLGIFAREFRNKSLSTRTEDTIIDSILAVPFLSFNHKTEIEEINDSLNLIIDVLRANGIIVDIERFNIKKTDFVPSSVRFKDDNIEYFVYQSEPISEYTLLT